MVYMIEEVDIFYEKLLNLSKLSQPFQPKKITA